MTALWIVAVLAVLAALVLAYQIIAAGGPKPWYAGLSDQWKATLRTAWQTVLGALATLATAAVSIPLGVLQGTSIEQALDSLSLAVQAAGVAVLGALAGVFAAWSNRGDRGARY